MSGDVHTRGAVAAGADRPVRAGRGRLWLAAAAAVAVVAASWWHTLGQSHSRAPGLAQALDRFAAFAGRLAGAGAADTPAWASAEQWRAAAALALDTLAMSVLAIAIAAAATVLALTRATRVFTTGEFGPAEGWAARASLLLVRGAHVLSRSVPELVWALLIVLFVRPGVLAGALALALHEIGVLGRLAADVVDDLDRAPLRALRAAGAGHQQLVWYGVLPQVLPQFTTFLLYRWEVVVRATVVVGFITGAGLGHELRLALSFRRWTQVALVLAVYVLLVWSAEALGAVLRRLARPR